MKHFGQVPTALVLFSLSIVFVACGQKQAATPSANSDASGRDKTAVASMISDKPDSAKLGVFASTDDGVKELVVYGEQTDETTFRLPDLSAVPTVKALYLNMPDVKVMASKLFFGVADMSPLPNFEEARDGIRLTPQIESAGGNMYKIQSSGLDPRRRATLILRVGMPLGTPDRVYFIKVYPR